MSLLWIDKLRSGKVDQPAPNAAAVNPSWRTGFRHVMIERKWPSNINRDLLDRTAIREDLTRKTQELAQFAPGMGAYMNEAYASKLEWQKTLWEDNYPCLLETKPKYDPSGVLTCGD
ncbi:hypothetical protein BOTBODRAFT_489531 [Botryobasidium botryosum FD-172 SS1]|uniref:Berberine/berberine-like domain-containing protein n=1 Tax=Botryobasidium botryosum (strain FD-172 SS1) TaxID=930990 RepID=A0A067MF92_BOTB1|nr:hypothetical protein BOTBODRAFT_489531 [Botryobasidium botryosum FD-172 SS1]